MQRTLKLMVVCTALCAGACASDDDGGKPSPAPVDAPDPGVMDTESGWVFRTVGRLTCSYDNDRDETITYGESTNNEMCFAIGFTVGFGGGCFGSSSVSGG